MISLREVDGSGFVLEADETVTLTFTDGVGYAYRGRLDDVASAPLPAFMYSDQAPAGERVLVDPHGESEVSEEEAVQRIGIEYAHLLVATERVLNEQVGIPPVVAHRLAAPLVQAFARRGFVWVETRVTSD